MSIYLKACKRCRGDLFLEYDTELGIGWICLQCGCRCEKAETLGNYGASLNEDGDLLKFELREPSSVENR